MGVAVWAWTEAVSRAVNNRLGIFILLLSLWFGTLVYVSQL